MGDLSLGSGMLEALLLLLFSSSRFLAISEAATTTCSMGGRGGVLIRTVGLSVLRSGRVTGGLGAMSSSMSISSGSGGGCHFIRSSTTFFSFFVSASEPLDLAGFLSGGELDLLLDPELCDDLELLDDVLDRRPLP